MSFHTLATTVLWTLLLAPIGLGAVTLQGSAEKEAPWRAMNYGPYRSSSLIVDSDNYANKAIAIRVDPGASPALVSFLEQEGYVVQRGGPACTLHLDGWSEFDDRDKRRVIDIIEQSDAALVRIWRWPNGARSVLSLTGDVDSMTLIDFLRRPLEV